MTFARIAISVLAAYLVSSSSAQVEPATRPSYVASVKAGKGADPAGFWTTHGRFLAKNVTAKFLVAIAYGLQKFQIAGGADWVDADRFDIEARLEDESATPGGEAPMIQFLLADRFKLQVHREVRESTVYALVVSGKGSRLKAVSSQGGVNVGAGQLVSEGMPIGLLASLLGTRLGRTVLDRTNLAGRYAIDLRWTPDPGEPPSDPGDSFPQPDSSGPSIFTAIQEQLGLKLQSTKGQSGFLVIDHIEKPTAN